MKNINYLSLVITSFLFLVCGTIGISAQTTQFTYQGRITDNGLPPTGNYDLQFALYDTISNGNQQGSTVTLTGVLVSGGVFTVPIDFGPQFDGNPRFLEISVKSTGSPNPYVTLSPRQSINSSPYAIRSKNASNADTATTATTAVNSTQLGGINANQYVTGPVVKTVNNLSDAVTLAAGSNISITPSGNTLTISSVGGPIGIQNQTAVQSGANFNIDGTGTANIVNAMSQFNIAGNRIISIPGTDNLFVGSNTGTQNTGFGNSFVGAFAARKNVGGLWNSFFGSGAGSENTAGISNSFFGVSAGASNLTGNNNVFAGYTSGTSNLTGSSNSFYGYRSGIRNTDGGANTFIGDSAGETNTVGTWNTALGAGSNVGAANLTNATAIGFKAFVQTSNSLVLGSINGVNFATANTNVGIGTSAPTARLHIADNSGNIVFGNGGCLSGFAGIGFSQTLNCGNYSMLGDGQDTIINRATNGDIIFRENNNTQMVIASGGKVSINTLGSAGSTQLCRNASNQISTCSSSLRYKKNVNPFVSGLNMVKQLRPISFDWKDGGIHDLGLGAEDVAKVNELLIIRNDKGEVEGVKYDRIGVVLINAVKEQQAQIARLQREIQSLKKRGNRHQNHTKRRHQR